MTPPGNPHSPTWEALIAMSALGRDQRLDMTLANRLSSKCAPRSAKTGRDGMPAGRLPFNE